MARHVQFGADAEHGSEGLVVHARKSEVETVHSSEVLARQSFCVRYEGGRRQTFLLGDSLEAGGLSPQASRRRASLSADSVSLPAKTSKVARKAKTAPKGDESDGSEEWDPSAEDQDVPLDSSLGSQFLSSLRISQMKNQQLTSEQVDLLRSIVETAQGILGSQKPLPEASEEGEETEATEPAVEALAVKAPAVEAAEIAAAPVAAPAFVPPRRSVAKVKIQEGSETVDFPAESKAHGEKIQRSHSEPPEVAASLEKAPTALKHFMDARSVSEIAEGFRYLLKCVELHQDETGASHSPEALPYQKIKSLPGLPWKAQQVWQLLDGQLKKEDCKAKPLRGKSVAVVGAGPVGLRIALQLKLAGASVTVLEKRCEFVRINRLHLWDWVKQDLIQWGAKVFSPPGGTFGADKDYCHIGISELQYLLLKCCLLMGVTVELGVSFRDTNYRAGQGWVALTDPALVPQELVVDALVCCDGAASRIAKSKGAVTIAGGLGKEGQAIGVVANFMNGKSPAERNLRQFSWARQFNGPLFKTLKDKVGAELQNIVYYRGDENHYMIMTPSKQCLVEKGCLHTAETLDGAALLRADNVELDNLKTLAQEVAVHFGLPSEFTPEQSVMIFDFSDTKRHEQAMLFQEADAGSGVPLAITMAGDALLEPFWPTGLGCIRGFLGAMDAVSCLSTWFVTKDREQALSKAEAAYRQLKSVDAQTKDMTLKPESEWRVEPSTRYRHM